MKRLVENLNWIYLLTPVSAVGLTTVILASMGSDFGWSYALCVFFGFLFVQTPIAVVGIVFGHKIAALHLVCLILSLTLFLISIGFWIHTVSDALTLNDIQNNIHRFPHI